MMVLLAFIFYDVILSWKKYIKNSRHCFTPFPVLFNKNASLRVVILTLFSDCQICDKTRSLVLDLSNEVSPLIDSIMILFYSAADRKDAFEIMSIGKETYVFRASNSREYRRWLKYLRLEAKELGGWKRRRYGLPNIMIKNLQIYSCDHTRICCNKLQPQ